MSIFLFVFNLIILIFIVYINHRPAFGLDPYEIYNSFKILNKGYEIEDDDSNQNHIPRFVFLNELQTKGICF